MAKPGVPGFRRAFARANRRYPRATVGGNNWTAKVRDPRTLWNFVEVQISVFLAPQSTLGLNSAALSFALFPFVQFYLYETHFCAAAFCFRTVLRSENYWPLLDMELKPELQATVQFFGLDGRQHQQRQEKVDSFSRRLAVAASSSQMLQFLWSQQETWCFGCWRRKPKNE